MTEEEYRSLCEVCDRLLLSENAPLERVAIPWLHVIREHPVFLRNYEAVFQRGNGLRARMTRLLRAFRSKAGCARQLLDAVQSRGLPWYGPQELPESIDVLFVSHLLNPSFLGQDDDFYFGSLPHELTASGQAVVIALINHSGKAAPGLSNKWSGNAVPRVIISDSLPLSEEAALLKRLRTESRHLKMLARDEESFPAKRILLQAADEALSGGALKTLRMSRQISALVSKLRPKNIVITYEGHAWERIAFAAARTVATETRCIGYQHAVLFRLQHAIRRALGPEYNPDRILTAGRVGQKQLEQAPKLAQIPISVLGSPRHSKKRVDRKEQSIRRACLVLPEGIPAECHLLFEFSLECARACPDIRFIWRLHPIIQFTSLVRKNSKLRNLPANVELSEATLEQDFSTCQWALYRGTTAIVQAVGAGLRPIYLSLPGELSIDPLYEMDSWRIEVSAAQEFQHAIHSVEVSSVSAEEYCGNIFQAMDHRVLIEAMK